MRIIARIFSSILFLTIATHVVAATTITTGKKSAPIKGFISFNFIDKPLVDLINEIAAEKKINIVLPQGAAAIQPTTKVTIHIEELLTLEQAWKQLIALLEIAGYTINQERDIYIIRKIDPNIIREPLPIYINEPLSTIPNTEQVVRALFYLRNISLKVSWDNLNTMMKDMLSTTADLRPDAKTNSLVITDKAVNIRAVMKIILELDKGGMPDSIDVIRLYYTSAMTVSALFNEQILLRQQRNGAQPTQEQASYFPKNTKITYLERNNELVIMGTQYAIDLVKDFIFKYIDRPLESGDSVLHIYDLQYLQAEDFAPILRSFVKPAETEQTAGKITTGPKQYFKDVVIVAEPKQITEAITPTTSTGETVKGSISPTTESAQVSGNRLIIAARKKDWIRIKRIIEELDKPELQVALEVLVADINLNNVKLLGSQMRNKQGFDNSISQDVDFQAAHLNIPILKQPEADPNFIGNGAGGQQFTPDALMANLLQLGAPFAENTNIASNMSPGSLVFTLRDKDTGVWSVWQVINNYTNATLIAQPFLTAKNHVQGTITFSEKRFVPGAATTANVSPVVKNEFIEAAFSIDLLPNISATGNINLQITVNVNQFINETTNTRITRVIQTNANMGNNQILAIGGLTRTRDSIDKTETPLFANIPVLGWFFKKKESEKEKTNLVVLIRPTVIAPKALGGIHPYTEQKLDFARNDLDRQLELSNLRDPITRWFFKPDVCFGQNTVEQYTRRAVRERYDDIAPTQQQDEEEITKEEIPKGLLRPTYEESTQEKITKQENEKLKTLVKDLNAPPNLPKGLEQASLQ